jgi:hypothetical protein
MLETGKCGDFAGPCLIYRLGESLLENLCGFETEKPSNFSQTNEADAEQMAHAEVLWPISRMTAPSIHNFSST